MIKKANEVKKVNKKDLLLAKVMQRNFPENIRIYRTQLRQINEVMRGCSHGENPLNVESV